MWEAFEIAALSGCKQWERWESATQGLGCWLSSPAQTLPTLLFLRRSKVNVANFGESPQPAVLEDVWKAKPLPGEKRKQTVQSSPCWEKQLGEWQLPAAKWLKKGRFAFRFIWWSRDSYTYTTDYSTSLCVHRLRISCSEPKHSCVLTQLQARGLADMLLL